MKRLFLLYAASSMTLLSSSEASHRALHGEQISRSVYVSDDGLSVLAMIGGELYIGNLASGETYTQIPQFIGAQGSIVDRSDAQMRCLSVTHITFAIPRSPHLGQRFGCNGLQFLIEHCSNNENCESFEVLATCARFRNGLCLPEGGDGADAALTYRLRGSTRTGIAEIDFDPSSEGHRLLLKEGAGIFGH